MTTTLPDSTVAFVAGIVDSRGHIRVEGRRGRPEPRIRVTTRRADLLKHLAKLTGTKVRVDNAGYERRPCSEHCRSRHQHFVRQSAYWNVDATRATILLAAIRPYVVCQVDEVRKALLTGLDNFPPTTGDVVEKMAGLGWPIPDRPARSRPTKPAKHGTRFAYQSGCRCAECKSAQAAYMRDYNARRRGA